MAIAIGLLLPAALLFLKEMLNSKVRGRKDIERLTIPFVGEIPQNGKPNTRRAILPGKKKPVDRSSDIVVKKGCNNIGNEAFRVIRTNLEFMTPGGAGNESRVIMITSANPGSGKTFIALNLATVLSLKGNVWRLSTLTFAVLRSLRLLARKVTDCQTTSQEIC